MGPGSWIGLEGLRSVYTKVTYNCHKEVKDANNASLKNSTIEQMKSRMIAVLQQFSHSKSDCAENGRSAQVSKKIGKSSVPGGCGYRKKYAKLR